MSDNAGTTTTTTTTTTNPALQMRAKRKSYMKCVHSNTNYNLIGEGFTNFSEAKNAKEYSRHYVHEESERSDVTGYAPSYSYSVDAVYGDPVVDEIIYITDHELTGNSTHREIVTYNEFEGTATARPAYKRDYSIVPDAAADGTEALVYTGTMKACGEKVEGTWNESTKTFTATTTTTTTSTTSSGVDGDSES